MQATRRSIACHSVASSALPRTRTVSHAEACLAASPGRTSSSALAPFCSAMRAPSRQLSIGWPSAWQPATLRSGIPGGSTQSYSSRCVQSSASEGSRTNSMSTSAGRSMGRRIGITHERSPAVDATPSALSSQSTPPMTSILIMLS